MFCSSELSTVDLELDSLYCLQKYGRPKRPCPFCAIPQSALSRHIKRQHSNEATVEQMSSYSPKSKVRALSTLRKKGILQYNIQAFSTGSRNLMRERRVNRKLGSESEDVVDRLKMCDKCSGVFGPQYIWRHKKVCCTKEADVLTCSSVKLVSALEAQGQLSGQADAFTLKVVDKITDDDIGRCLRKDDLIKGVGRAYYQRNPKRQKRKGRHAVMALMRKLAKLLVTLRSLRKDASLSAESLLDPANFEHLLEALDQASSKKANVKLSMAYALKKSVTHMFGQYLIGSDMERYDRLKQFEKLLTYKWDDITGEAVYQNDMRRQEHLRKPKQLPIEEDMDRLKAHCLSVFDEYSDPYRLMCTSDFITLRAAACTRLTVFNARRGGEPADLELRHLEEAMRGEWINPQEATSEEEKKLISRYKLVYQTQKAKGLVPVLLPEDCISALNKLVQCRESVGISKENTYLFPFTQGSSEPVSGWHELKKVCKDAGVSHPELINANRVRHRAATKHARDRHSKADKDAFLRHIGHSETVDQQVYQCPLGVAAVCRVGPFLEELDSGTRTGKWFST